MKRYELVLKNEKAKGFRLITLLILILNYSALLYLSAIGFIAVKAVVVYFIVSALTVFIQYYFKNPGDKPNPHTLFMILLIAWFTTDFWWVAIPNFIFYMLHIITQRPLKVVITPRQIIYPSFPQRKIQWNELSNLIIKDGLLTIDFKSNRIIQQPVEEISPAFDEEEFNEFCKQQLNK